MHYLILSDAVQRLLSVGDTIYACLGIQGEGVILSLTSEKLMFVCKDSAKFNGGCDEAVTMCFEDRFVDAVIIVVVVLL